MENSVRYKRLQAALLQVYTDREMGRDDKENMEEVSSAGAELFLNYQGGGIQDSLGRANKVEVETLRELARRLHSGESGVNMQEDLKNYFSVLPEPDLHC